VDAAPSASPGAPALFDLEDGEVGGTGVPHNADAAVEEFRRQREALAAASDPARLELLLAAESAGALVAAEMHAAGVPWDRAVHEGILEASLGTRPALGRWPRASANSATSSARRSETLPQASILSRSCCAASTASAVLAESTSRWELARFDHPAIAPPWSTRSSRAS
jgi:DNA polymerase-1